MLNINRADRMIESLEIMASDNYYPIEDNDSYNKMIDMVENADYKGESFVDKEDFTLLYNKVKKAIDNF